MIRCLVGAITAATWPRRRRQQASRRGHYLAGELAGATVGPAPRAGHRKCGASLWFTELVMQQVAPGSRGARALARNVWLGVKPAGETLPLMSNIHSRAACCQVHVARPSGRRAAESTGCHISVESVVRVAVVAADAAVRLRRENNVRRVERRSRGRETDRERERERRRDEIG